VSFTERVLGFQCGGELLPGILSQPEVPRGLGVVIIVGGPQYRVGSHRQFVHLARHIAAAGYPCLRFDYRGMGDCAGALRNFEQVSEDIGAAVDALFRAVPGVQRAALWGLCDGASAALLYLADRPDPRVRGLALLNPWVRTVASQAQTRVKHYYLARLADPAFWRKLLRGGVGLKALTGLAGNLRAAFGRGEAAAAAPRADYPTRMAQAWQAFEGRVLLMLSEHDYTAREFEVFSAGQPGWKQAFAARPPERVHLPGADHTCADPQARSDVESATARWLDALAGDAP